VKIGGNEMILKAEGTEKISFQSLYGKKASVASSGYGSMKFNAAWRNLFQPDNFTSPNTIER
jgi:hypothetical protein